MINFPPDQHKFCLAGPTNFREQCNIVRQVCTKLNSINWIGTLINFILPLNHLQPKKAWLGARKETTRIPKWTFGYWLIYPIYVHLWGNMYEKISNEMNSIWSDGEWYDHCKLSQVKLEWFKEDCICWCWPVFCCSCCFLLFFYEISLEVVAADYTRCSVQCIFVLCVSAYHYLICSISLLFGCVLAQISLFVQWFFSPFGDWYRYRRNWET